MMVMMIMICAIQHDVFNRCLAMTNAGGHRASDW